MDTPNSASELAQIARDGTGRDVLGAVEAMNAKHGPGITALMMYSAGETLRRELLAQKARDSGAPETTLKVCDSYATCMHCGQGADPDASTHDQIVGYGTPGEGCGALFTAIKSDRAVLPEWLRVRLCSMRFDLPLLDAWDRPIGGA